MTTISAETSSRTIELGQHRIHYHDIGTGQPVIMLHGGGPGASAWSNYHRNLTALANNYRLLLVDMPGYGRSSNADLYRDPIGLRAEVIVEFIEALSLQRPHLLGNSLGGAVSLMAAIKAPDKIGRLVLMGPAGGIPLHQLTPTQGIIELFAYYEGDGPSREKLKSFTRHLVYDPSAITDELIESRYQASIAEEVMKYPPLMFKPEVPMRVFEVWREPGLATLPNPVLLVWGREDRTNPADAALLLQKLIPHCDTYLMTRCGHWAQWEHADKFNKLTHAFLSSD